MVLRINYRKKIGGAMMKRKKHNIQPLEVKVEVNRTPCLLLDRETNKPYCICDGSPECKFPHEPERCNYFSRHIASRIKIEVRYS